MTIRKTSADGCAGRKPDDQEKASSGYDELGPAMVPPSLHDTNAVAKSSLPSTASLSDGVADGKLNITVTQPRVLRKGLGMKRKLDVVATGETVEAGAKRILLSNEVICRPLSVPLPGLHSPMPASKVSSEIIKSMEDHGAQLDVVKDPNYAVNLSPDSAKTVPEPTPVQSEYVFTVKPLMGESFDVSLSSDSSIFDLKDAIFNKTGMIHEMQLLGHSKIPLNFEQEEKFLDETCMPNHCVLSLSVKAATGKPMVQSPLDNGEDYVIEGIFIPRIETMNSNSSTDDDHSDADLDSEGQGKWKTVPLSNIPHSVAESYLGRSIIIDDALQDLESLRIEMVTDKVQDGSSSLLLETTGMPMPRAIPTVQAGPPRCFHCGIRCRLGQQFRCKCSHMFCPLHRFDDQHNCPFDHLSHDRTKLDQANPKVNKSRVDHL